MLSKTVEKIREFNRFYMPAMALLGCNYLGSEYSPAEARVFFEIYENDGCNAAHIAKAMNIDKSYLSRIIKAHEKSGYLTRSRSEKDQRAYALHLTEKGRAKTESFIESSNRQIGGIISGLDKDDCMRLTEAMQVITDILKKCD